MSMHFRRAIAVLAVVLFGATLATPVGAQQPLKEKGEAGFEFTNPNRCGEGSDLTFRFDRVSEEITFFDEAGQPTRKIRAFRSELVFTRSDTGKTAIDTNRVTRIDYYDGGEIVRTEFSGPQIILRTNGQKPIGIVVGRFVEEGDEIVFEKGIDTFPEDFVGAICAALA